MRRFLLVVAVVVLVGAGWFVWSSRQSPSIDAPEANLGQQTPITTGLPSLDARTIAAMRVVYSGADENTGLLVGNGPQGEFASAGGAPVTAPLLLVDLEAGPVLVTETTSDDAAHTQSGFLSAFYLHNAPSGLKLKRAFVDFGGHGEFGRAGRAERITIEGQQGLVVRTGGGGMGCMMEMAAIYAITDAGPQEILASEFVSYRDASSFSEGDEVSGAIIAPPAGYDMALRFTGQHFGDLIDETVLYRMQAGRLVAVSGANPLADGC